MVDRHGSDPKSLELPKLMRLANHPTPTLACLPAFLVRRDVLRSDMRLAPAPTSRRLSSVSRAAYSVRWALRLQTPSRMSSVKIPSLCLCHMARVEQFFLLEHSRSVKPVRA